MTPLDTVFESHLPALLTRAKKSPKENSVFGFAATGGPETGYWVLSLDEWSCRRGGENDRPDVLIQGDAQALVLLFSGGLHVEEALKRGVIDIRGDHSLLRELISFLGRVAPLSEA